jgi:hypothetical protein
MLDPSPEVRAEAEGLERFALQMSREGLGSHPSAEPPLQGERLLVDPATGDGTARDGPLRARTEHLDIGANTCWATATFARIGLRTVALDISMIEMQVLRTADWWFQENGTYFERVLVQATILAVD